MDAEQAGVEAVVGAFDGEVRFCEEAEAEGYGRGGVVRVF